MILQTALDPVVPRHSSASLKYRADWSRRLQPVSLGLALLVMLTSSPSGFAQVHKSASSAALASKATPSSDPAWAELTPLQQQALAPMAASWNTVGELQKRKWLEISKNYAALPPEGQATLHSRMNEWIALSPQQRAQARLNFGKTKELSRQLTPEEKRAKWEAYQALSPEEKQKLAAKASPSPTGAATAVKPVSPQKLTLVPPQAGRPAAKPAPKIMPSPPPTVPTPAAPPAGEMAAPVDGAAAQH